MASSQAGSSRDTVVPNPSVLVSRAVPPEELQRWLEQTVLPRKAPWIAITANSAPTSSEIGGSKYEQVPRPLRYSTPVCAR
jgi:hypothetical protein